MVSVALLGLGGCTSSLGPEWATLAGLVRGDFAAERLQTIPSNPDPAFRYLRVQLEGFPAAMLVLGYVDAHPLGPIEVWYSARGDVLRLQNGRITATTGLPLDWSAVQFDGVPQLWGAVGQGGATFTRVRSEMPSYRFGIIEQVWVHPVPGLVKADLPFAVPASLSPEKMATYHWFRESVAQGSPGALPDSWFALGKHLGQSTVVYSRQCLSADYCLHLQRWPVQEDAL